MKARLTELKPFEQPGSFQNPMSGAPLRYERNDSEPGEFELWSVGLNGDDGDHDVQHGWAWPR